MPQVSDARSSALETLGIFNIADLLNYFPQNYLDLTEVCKISNTNVGHTYSIMANVHAITEKEPKPGMDLVEITLTDETGTLIVAAFKQK